MNMFLTLASFIMGAVFIIMAIAFAEVGFVMSLAWIVVGLICFVGFIAMRKSRLWSFRDIFILIVLAFLGPFGISIFSKKE